jgi:catalase
MQKEVAKWERISGPNYYPNTFGGPAPRPEVAEPPFEVTGKAARQPYSHPNDDFAQPGALYRDVMNDEERDKRNPPLQNRLRTRQVVSLRHKTYAIWRSDHSNKLAACST